MAFRFPIVPSVLLLALLAGCEGPVWVSGRVTDPAGNPVPHALLRIRDDGFTLDSARSGEDGRFRLDWFYHFTFASHIGLWAEAPGFYRTQQRVRMDDSSGVILFPRDGPRPRLLLNPPEWQSRLGIGYGLPLRLTWTLGAAYGRYRGTEDFRGWVGSFEPATAGARVRLGRTWVHGRQGADLAAAALYTRNQAWTVAGEQGYAGGELRLFHNGLYASAGGYSRVSGSAPGDAHLFAVSLGFGR
jgi:hypothetical protein